MRSSFLVLLLLLVLVSCTGRKRIPKGVLPPDKMEKVLYDVLLAEGYAESYLYADSSMSKEAWMNKEMDKVLAIHKVSQETFMSNGEALVYTAKETIEYDNTDMPVEIFWVKSGYKFLKGKYNVELYHSGVLIGKSSIELK